MYNRVFLIGHIGQPPEIRAVDDRSVANFRLATNKLWRDDDGEPQESTEWHTCALWRDDLGRFVERVGVGTLLFVEGELVHREEEHKGVRRRWTSVRVRTYRVLKPRAEDGGGGEEEPAVVEVGDESGAGLFDGAAGDGGEAA